MLELAPLQEEKWQKVHQHDMRQRHGERSKDDNAYVQRRMWQCRTDSWAIAVVNESELLLVVMIV
jgi:hypothetical protein